MKGTYEVFWSVRASHDLEAIIDYLLNNWSEKEVRKFIRKLDKRINLISLNPLLFPAATQKINIRRSVLSKQTTIYYRITDEIVQIITLFDVRQNPNRLKI